MPKIIIMTDDGRHREELPCFEVEHPSETGGRVRTAIKHAFELEKEAEDQPDSEDWAKDLGPVIDAWDVVERFMEELGFTGPARSGMPFRSRAEELSKALMARLAHHDPPILPIYHDDHP